MAEEKKLRMIFDPNVISHLGIQMYSTLPPVLSELIANSYDADAENVTIYLNDSKEKQIIIEDDGHGMTFDEINEKFLKVGRDRRIAESTDKSKIKGRDVIGRKGIGKLSFFGVSKTITIETILDYKANSFKLAWEDLKRQGETSEQYEPEVLGYNVSSKKKSGTKITLSEIKRKSNFAPSELAYSLSKYFQIFDLDDFEVKIFHNSKEITESPLRNSLRYRNIDSFLEWTFPEKNDKINAQYKFKDQITGKIIASKDNTIPNQMNGIALFSRGKLVNNYSFFDLTASSHGYSYITGWLNVDFIENFEDEVISTNRQSLNWESEKTEELKDYLQNLVRAFYNKQRQKKEEDKKATLKSDYDIDIEEWLKGLPKRDRALAKKISKSILNAEGIEHSKSIELIKFVKDAFQFESFKEFARDLGEIDETNTKKIVELFKEWEFIEAREMFKLATGRVKAIETFEKLIFKNALEVKEIHPFFEKFPWILDPRINMFRHEAQYISLLQENYPEKELEEKNRRIDFLCTSVSNHRFIIEIKRPHHKISDKDINQAKDYRSFIESYCNTDVKHPNRVIAYVVGGSIKDDRKTKDEINSMQQVDKVYAVTFNQLLSDAKHYHLEFIEKYKKIKHSK